ncbi:MAG: hypothetical protein O7C67_11845 [Gammaproteobacteria bacterium]|nr:hypothetical protein [Gammaproteobacteria bacterium]
MRKLFVLVLVIVVAAGAWVVWFIQDANRFKPELLALIEEETGVPVEIRGNLRWRLNPPLLLTAEDIHAEYDGRQWSLARLALHVNLASLIAERKSFDEWQIDDLTLTDLVMLDGNDRLEVAELELSDLGLDTRVPMATKLTYTPAGGTPIPLSLTGDITYHSATEAIDLDDFVFDVPYAQGQCDLELVPSRRTWPPSKSADGALLPLDTLREFNWNGTCDLARVTYQERDFEDVRLALDNSDAKLRVSGHVPAFFGGTADLEINIAADQQPVTWTITPTLDNVDSQQLIDWLDQSLQWAAPIAYGGTFELTGNTTEELASSVTGRTHFDGGQGQLNIAKIKRQLLAIALLLGKSDTIQRWPDVLDYQRFVGDWRIDRQHHTLDFALDNLTVLAEGDYDINQDRLDMLAELTFGDDPALSSLDVNPLLVGLPIPVRCRGTLEDPTCKVDDNVAKRLVASALRAKEGSALRTKLDDAIEDKIPEEYRDAARSLLDLLGRSLGKED